VSAAEREQQEDAWFTPERVLLAVLAVITAIVFYLCYLLVRPFVPALAWALAIAVVAYPLHAWIQRRLKRKSLVAGVTVLVVTITVLVPTILVVHHATNDAISSAENFKGVLSNGQLRSKLERNEMVAEGIAWLEKRINVGNQFEQAAKSIVGGVKEIVTGSVQVVTGLLVTLFLLYYFFRDKDKLLQALRDSAPLSPREADYVFRKVGDTITAIIYGTLLLAAVQGTLGGLMFWVLGLPSPVLWGVVMALLAILPVIGAAFVWVPAALYLLLAEGSWEKALILTAWGSIVVGLIDNVLYPLFVKNRLRMHTVPVFIAVLGGLVVFGTAGIVLGPVILAVAVALAGVWRRRMADGEAVENNVDTAEAAAPAPQRR
jgi:predicted PurR-regulated permease PerM